MLAVRDRGAAVVAEITIVKSEALETAVLAYRVDVHFADASCLVSAVTQFLRQHMVIIPVDSIFITNPAVICLTFPGKESRSCRNTAWTGRIGMSKEGAFGGERIQIWCLYIRVAGKRKAVAPELIAH